MENLSRISVEEKEDDRQKSSTFLPIVICALALPVSMVMWIGNLAFSFFALERTHLHEDGTVIPPTRWLAATGIPLFIAAWGLKKKSLDKSGAGLGLFMGFILTLTSYSFLASLLMFFVSSSKATKFRANKKRKLEEDFREGGQRNWVQVLCNGGIATLLAILYLLDVGWEERPIDFYKDYRASWLGLGILGSLACCNGDTWASELGAVVGGGEPFLITTRKRVPRGTNGGVTFAGLFFSVIGGAAVGLAYYVALLYCVDPDVLGASPQQWPLIVVGALAGLFGGIVDSLLGATLQYSGLNERTGCVVERAGRGVRHISGIQLLDNHSVNLVSSLLMGLLTPKFAGVLFL
ncbi:hypothetical protein R5R35_012842 [Gryllus longicercus]|uniref:Transmembrane protein 19 n=1 Tax=Gryllus longicercus TaxID=2509291 RepID=A0AAN9VC20_9ORTH